MEILVGTNSPIKHRVFWKGEVVDSDDLPQVKLYDITEDPEVSPSVNPSQLLTTLTATKIESDNGVYEVYPPLQYTNRPRTLKLVWEYEVEGTPVSQESKVFVSTPYVDLGEAANALGVGADYSDPNKKTYQEMLEAERYARKLIETFTGQRFYLQDASHTLYGNETDTLPLPRKINKIHKIYSNDILLVDNLAQPPVNNWGYSLQISESGFGVRINRANMLDNTVYTANGMVPPSITDTSGVFSNHITYILEGRFGWEDVPDEISMACLELMKDYFSKDKVWRNKYIKNISTFDWKFEYDSATFSGTGNNYVDQILSDYVITQMVVI
jgi:hypothetical protein